MGLLAGAGAPAVFNLYTGTIKATGGFVANTDAAGAVTANSVGVGFSDTATANPHIYFGSANDVNLGKVGAGNLQTSASFTIQGSTLTMNNDGAAACVISVGGTNGLKIGSAITSKLSTYGVTPVTQRAGAAQAAVAVTGATNVTPFGYTTAAQADAIVTLVNELRAALVAFGIIKGSA